MSAFGKYFPVLAPWSSLPVIKELTGHTISISREMQQDMDKLVAIIGHLSDVISGINSISLQTLGKFAALQVVEGIVGHGAHLPYRLIQSPLYLGHGLGGLLQVFEQ